MLLEWTLMLELLAAGRLRAVVPILMGEHDFDPADPAGTKASNGGGGLMGSLFQSRAYRCLSTAVHDRVNAQAQCVLKAMGIQPSALLHGRTIKKVVEEISGHLGIQAHEHFTGAGAGPGSAVGASLKRQRGGILLHEWEAGMRRLVQAVRKILMGMLDPAGARGSGDAPSSLTAATSTHQAAEMARLRAAEEIERLRAQVAEAQVVAVAAAAAAAEGKAASSAELGLLKVQASESERMRAAEATEMERLRAAAATDDASAQLAVELERLRATAEMERLRAAAEMERLRAEVAGAQAVVAAAEAKAAFSAEIARLRAEASETERARAQPRAV